MRAGGIAADDTALLSILSVAGAVDRCNLLSRPEAHRIELMRHPAKLGSMPAATRYLDDIVRCSHPGAAVAVLATQRERNEK